MAQPVDQKHTCAICLDEISFHVYHLEEMPTATDCKHVFHMNCLEEWSKQKFNCPLCRKDIETLDIAGPVTYESIRRLERVPYKESAYMTAIRVACAAIYLTMMIKMLESKSKPPISNLKV